MRDQLKNKEYFEKFFKIKFQLTELNNKALSDGKVHESKVDWAKYGNLGHYIESLITQYSLGYNLTEIGNSIKKIIQLTPDLWIPTCTKVHDNKGLLYDKYFIGPYERFLQILSLAYLLEIPIDDFQILVDIIDRDNISDNLYEFIIKARFPERIQKKPEIYETDSATLKAYDKLRKATEQSDKVEASKLVELFLEKDFYHKHMNLYNSHNSKADIYCGYWSFESAAVVKIMGLDDSSFIDQQYYPKDLVHISPEPAKKEGLFGK